MLLLYVWVYVNRHKCQQCKHKDWTNAIESSRTFQAVKKIQRKKGFNVQKVIRIVIVIVLSVERQWNSNRISFKTKGIFKQRKTFRDCVPSFHLFFIIGFATDARCMSYIYLYVYQYVHIQTIHILLHCHHTKRLNRTI